MTASLQQADALSHDRAVAQFPVTRYQGSKAKLVDWIWEQVAGLQFHTCLDAFGGTGVVAYRFKQAGKCVTYNDSLAFNAVMAKGLIENPSERLIGADIDWLLARHSDVAYSRFVQDTFHDIYYTDEENAWIDQTIANIRAYEGVSCDHVAWTCRQALAFFALCQACIVKRPYNLFHRRNLYLRFAPVQRTFGNKAGWDRPFEQWFRHFAAEANRAVFDNGQPNIACNDDAANLPGAYDLVYIDPPYMPARGSYVDYRGFYHFLEGLTRYDTWADDIDTRSRHRRLRPCASVWANKATIHSAFDQLFDRYRDSILVVSYRNDGTPSPEELTALLRRYKPTVRLAHYGPYKYALSTNDRSTELLLIGV